MYLTYSAQVRAVQIVCLCNLPVSGFIQMHIKMMDIFRDMSAWCNGEELKTVREIRHLINVVMATFSNSIYQNYLFFCTLLAKEL